MPIVEFYDESCYGKKSTTPENKGATSFSVDADKAVPPMEEKEMSIEEIRKTLEVMEETLAKLIAELKRKIGL